MWGWGGGGVREWCVGVGRGWGERVMCKGGRVTCREERVTCREEREKSLM